MRKKVTKAIFPVAGLGTRFLPATKSVPKEIMTLADRPLIQYTIDEARAAGIKKFIFVTSRGKGALEDCFDHAPALEQELRKKGKDELLEVLKIPTWIVGQSPTFANTRPLVWGTRCGARVGLSPMSLLRLFYLTMLLRRISRVFNKW